MSLTLREVKLLKQRRKKSGPPCSVDFKGELTSSVLTSCGFHCIYIYIYIYIYMCVCVCVCVYNLEPFAVQTKAILLTHQS